MAVAFFAGLSMPPIQPAVRTIYPKMVNSRQLTPLFSLDASAQEIIWIAGPVAITFVSTQIGTVEGILMSVAIMLIGGGLVHRLARGRPGAHPAQQAPVRRRAAAAARAAGDGGRLPAHRLLRGGRGRRRRELRRGLAVAGIVLAIWSLGSLVGGLAFGHLPIGPWATRPPDAHRVRRRGRSRTFMLGSWWGLSLSLIVAGLGIAPALGGDVRDRVGERASSATRRRRTAGSAPASSSARRSARRSRAS